jgi:S1-C subfamily serine protease
LTTLSDQQMQDAAEVAIIRVYEKVSPAVVHITSRVVMMDFFGGFTPQEGTGSGFVIDKQGHIVTNNHVVEGAESIEVVLRDKTVVEAKLVGTDPLNDLAVLKINVEADKLVPVDMSFSGQLKVGQTAIAIGNPFGLDWTLTSGVISSLGRPLDVSDSRTIYDVIQTDAAINPGNSGGPLLNSRGQLIGVNTAIRQGAQNIGFAVSLAAVQRIVPVLIAKGRYPHPTLGANGYTLFPELARRLSLPTEKGVLLVQVAQDSAAAQAGLRGATRNVIIANTRVYVGGDILVALDDTPIESSAALREFIQTRTVVGQEVQVKFYRGDKLTTAKAKLTEMRQ